MDVPISKSIVDKYSIVAFAKLYDRENALAAADILNDRLIPWFEQEDARVLRLLTDRGTEYKEERILSGRYGFRETPNQAFGDSKQLADKNVRSTITAPCVI